MRLSFEEIPTEGVRITVNDVSWFPDWEVQHKGTVTAEVHLRRLNQRIFMAGTVAARFVFECDRCLSQYENPRQLEFKLEIEMAGAEEPGKEHACSENEMDTMFVSEPMVDIYSILRQQVLLTIPLKHLCREDCQGLCPGCGVNSNEAECVCDRASSQSPFGILASLKKD